MQDYKTNLHREVKGMRREISEITWRKKINNKVHYNWFRAALMPCMKDNVLFLPEIIIQYTEQEKIVIWNSKTIASVISY